MDLSQIEQHDGMLKFFISWYRRYFSDPQAVLLAVMLLIATIVLMFMGGMLAPMLAALVIAYLLEGAVSKLEKYNIPRLAAVIIVFVFFIAVLGFSVFGLFPLLSHQMIEFVQALPSMINEGQKILLDLPEKYPQFFSTEQVYELIRNIRKEIALIGQKVVSTSIASIPTIFTLIIYCVLGPILVFFFLKDKGVLIEGFTSFLPKNRQVLTHVWMEMDQQIGNYIRGKFYEMIIVGLVTYVVLSLFGMSYAPLLAVLVGLSVIIPFIGAFAVTIPVAIAAYYDFGLTPEFTWALGAYMVIQILDGNLLVPVLFSEAVNLHPVSIIIAVLVFGGIWGVWGVFFAIPLATLVKSLINAWPKAREKFLVKAYGEPQEPMQKKVVAESPSG